MPASFLNQSNFQIQEFPISKSLSLYPQIGAAPTPHHKSFFLQQMENTTGIHKWP